MKKLVSILASAIILSVTNATASPHPAPSISYDVGYRHGKNDAYHTVATVAVVTGILVAAGIVIYKASDSRWGVNDKGVVYRF